MASRDTSAAAQRAWLGALVLYGRGTDPSPNRLFEVAVGLASRMLAADSEGVVLHLSLLDSVWSDPTFPLTEKLGVTAQAVDRLEEAGGLPSPAAAASIVTAFCGTLAVLANPDSMSRPWATARESARRDSLSIGVFQTYLLRALVRAAPSDTVQLAIAGLVLEARRSEHYAVVLEDVRRGR